MNNTVDKTVDVIGAVIQLASMWVGIFIFYLFLALMNLALRPENWSGFSQALGGIVAALGLLFTLLGIRLILRRLKR